jgi:hypothetical protein
VQTVCKTASKAVILVDREECAINKLRRLRSRMEFQMYYDI